MSTPNAEKPTPLDKIIAHFSKYKNQYLSSDGIVYLAKQLKDYYDEKPPQ